jgi:1,4-dihydroxy-2-naphthoyl-CoA hydrolase
MGDQEQQDFAQVINAAEREGWVTTMGLRLVRATRDEVVGEIEIRPLHHQAYGIVHGGVYAGIVETLASVGAAIDAFSRGQSVVGLENHTTFLRAVRSGKLQASAKPLTRGRRTQVWEGTVYDESGLAVAKGSVRLLVLDAGSKIAGEQVGIKP